MSKQNHLHGEAIDGAIEQLGEYGPNIQHAAGCNFEQSFRFTPGCAACLKLAQDFSAAEIGGAL